MSSPLKAFGKSPLGAYDKSPLGARTAGGPVNYHIWYSSHVAIQFFDFHPSMVLNHPSHPRFFQMDDVEIKSGGRGYTSTPDVTTSGGLYYTDPRNKAELTAVFEAGVKKIKVTNPGSGYSRPPTVVIKGGKGAGAKAEAVLDSNGSVESIEVTDKGHGYKTPPNVTFEDEDFLPDVQEDHVSATAEISGEVVDVIITGMRGFYGYLGEPTTPEIVFSGGRSEDEGEEEEEEEGGSEEEEEEEEENKEAEAKAVMSTTINFPDQYTLYGLNPDLYATNSADTLYDKITYYGASEYNTLDPLRPTDSTPIRFRIWAYQEEDGTGEIFLHKLEWDEKPTDEDLDGLLPFKGRVELNAYALDRGEDYPNTMRSESLMKPDIEIRFGEYEKGIQDEKVKAINTVCKIIVTESGKGYSSPNAIFSGDGGHGASATVTIIRGQITKVHVTSGGEGYVGPIVEFDSVGGGEGAQATAVVSDGKIVRVDVTSGGEGYSVGPKVVLETKPGKKGSGAKARAVMRGTEIAYVEVIDGGEKYDAEPDVSFEGGSPSTPAEAQAKVNLAGTVKTWEVGKEIELVQDDVLGMMGFSVDTESNQLDYELDNFNNRYPTLGRFKGFGVDDKVYGKLLDPDKYQDPYLRECPTHLNEQNENIESGKPFDEYVGILVTLVPGKKDRTGVFRPLSTNGKKSIVPTFWLDDVITGNDYYWYYLLTKNLHGTEEFTTTCARRESGPYQPPNYPVPCNFETQEFGWLSIPPCVDDDMTSTGVAGGIIRYVPYGAAGSNFWFPGGGSPAEVSSPTAAGAAGLYSAYGPNKLTATVPYALTAGGPDGGGAFAMCGDSLASSGSLYCDDPGACKWYIFYKSVFDTSTEDGTINPNPENYYYVNPSVYFAGVDDSGSYWIERSTHRLSSVNCIPNGMYGTTFFPDPAFHDIPYYPPATEWEWFFDLTGPSSKRRWAELNVDEFTMLGHRDTPATAVPRRAWYPVMGLDSWYGDKAFYKFPFTFGTFNYLYGGYFSTPPNLDNYYNYYGVRIFSTTVRQSIANVGMQIAKERYKLLIDSLPGAEQVMQHIRQMVQQDVSFISNTMQSGGNMVNFGGVVSEMMPPGYQAPQFWE